MRPTTALNRSTLSCVYDFGDYWDWAAAGLIDTDLSFLELCRTDVAGRRMTARRVVGLLDWVEHIGAGLLPLPLERLHDELQRIARGGVRAAV